VLDTTLYDQVCLTGVLDTTLYDQVCLTGVLDTTLYDQVCHWLVAGRWFSPFSFTNKTDRHDIIEILLKVALNTISPYLTVSDNIQVAKKLVFIYI
jgi:hypothetical protein